MAKPNPAGAVWIILAVHASLMSAYRCSPWPQAPTRAAFRREIELCGMGRDVPKVEMVWRRFERPLATQALNSCARRCRADKQLVMPSMEMVILMP